MLSPGILCVLSALACNWSLTPADLNVTTHDLRLSPPVPHDLRLTALADFFLAFLLFSEYLKDKKGIQFPFPTVLYHFYTKIGLIGGSGLKGQWRYDTSGLEEVKFEPGSNGRVLKNLLGIKRKREMDQIEAKEHLRTLEELIKIYNEKHRFTASDVCRIHKIWLGSIYSWAGKYRLINLSKDNFPFAPAREIPRLMNEFEKGPLREYTPCHFGTEGKIAEALAVVHTELWKISLSLLFVRLFRLTHDQSG